MDATCRLFVAFELSEKNWKLSLGDGVRAPSGCAVLAGDPASVLSAITKARVRCHLHADALVLSCYEAGRDRRVPTDPVLGIGALLGLAELQARLGAMDRP